MTKLSLIATGTVLMLSVTTACAGAPKPPLPRTGHPGNIFVAGEKVTVSLGTNDAGPYRLVDYEGKRVAEPVVKDGRIQLGALPVGYYELVSGSSAPPVSIGVIERLRAPVPDRSPIGIDVAMAWFYPTGTMDAAASLCALAGMNYVRDRLSWGELEPKRGDYAQETRYDASAHIQAEAGLKVLQVSHMSPAWANPVGKRFPLDLRDSYNFHREMARRWRGQVIAFEPWNEADIPMFGGHTGSEMASLQKAAYLGIKAGNPGTIACLNVFAVHRESTLRDLHDNAAWPYFDTFNLHHYEPFDAYPKLYADFRAVSAGKPLWVTECSRPVKWRGDEKLKEPTPEDLRVQSERVPMTYALSLHEGAEAVFYFLLPHYSEGQTQFGIVRPDLTPRPAYVALAAAGRLLAGARPLGRMSAGDDSTRVFVFTAVPDGKPRRVLVAWSKTATELSLPVKPVACFDHLGRPCPAKSSSLKLGPAPIYAVLPASAQLTLVPPPPRPPLLPGSPCPVVLQALVPEGRLDLEKSGYRLSAGTNAFSLFAYNFGQKPVEGSLRCAAAPEGWQVELPSRVRLAPGAREELRLAVRPGNLSAKEPAVVRLVGDFPGAGQAVLSLRFVPGQP